MFIPNPFVPSSVNHQTLYDEEGRVKTFRHSSRGPNSDGGIAEANSLYATDAELFGTITPFLKMNRINDSKRRNYVIQPGGACIYFKEDERLADPYAHGKVQFTAPSERTTFGHDSLDGSKLSEPNGRAFTIGQTGTGT